MKPGARFAGGVVAAALALSLGVLAAWPIYRTAWLWVVALAALAIGTGVVWARERWRLSFPVTLAITLGAFVVTVVPVAVPQSLTTGFLRGFLDGLAAVALGWKQLLTLTLPVGTYRTALVPVYVVLLATTVLIVLLASRARRLPVLAALPMVAPVAFGTVFGASEVSAPLRLGPLAIAAPRELGLWLGAAVLAGAWIVWTSGAERRAALRLGRASGETAVQRRGAARSAIGAGILVVALAIGALCAPLLDAGARAVPRDGIDPEIVVRDSPSPLASYRNSKRDDAIDEPLFSVRASGSAPERLRLAVLDAYDGVDFHVSAGAAGRFTRFPSGDPLASPGRVSIEVGAGYSDIWVPEAGLGSPPEFTGPRAAELSDAFYVNRETGAAIAVPRGAEARTFGLRAGDRYSALMETAPPAAGTELGDPASQSGRIDLETVPELAEWIERQNVSNDASGFAELVQRLRDRGYLSHSMTDGEGDGAWIQRLQQRYGTVFESSAGGHSLARVELLFSQLNAQEKAAGEHARPEQLVAGIGDDEQFAAAAALIARALGYDSRVVVGVRLGGEEVPGVPVCAEDCTGDNLAAWVEVRGSGADWVPFDVTPQVSERPQRLEQGEQLPEFPTISEERDAQEVDPPVGLGEQGEGAQTKPEKQELAWLGPLLRTAGLSLAALALLALPFLFLPLAKRLRAKRRRGAAEPELRALGAWEEMVDRARDAGVEIPDRAGRAQVAAALGTAPAAWAADEVDRAVFSPSGIGEEDADMLWRATEADAEERRASMSRFERLRAAYSLRSYGIGFGRFRAAAREGGNA